MQKTSSDRSLQMNGEPVHPGAGCPALYPPTVAPPEHPLSLPAFLRQFPKNPLRAVPRGAYEDDITVLRSTIPAVTYAWITGPQLVEETLIGAADKLVKSRAEKRVFDKGFGASVLTSDGDKWRWQRRALAPLFRPKAVLDDVPAMVAAAEEQVEAWRSAGAGVRNVEHDMTEATMAVILRAMLAKTDMNLGHRIMAATESYLARAPWEAAYAILRLPLWLPHPGTWQMGKASRDLRVIMKELIDERRLSVSGSNTDLLGRLIDARDPETDAPLDDEGLVNNLSTLLLAGHETTAKALTWTLYLLARAPAWQQAVREEVLAVAGQSSIQADHVDALDLTSRVLKEGMRLYPPAPVVARVNTEFMMVGGENLPAGSNIVFPMYAIHRHRKYWRDPNRLDPDRFLDELTKDRPRTQYMPFGAGPRICIGQAFAMVEATVLLATFVRAARFTWVDHYEPEPISRITLTPSGGMPLRVEPIIAGANA